MGCMTELQWSGMPCPKCGFDIRKYQRPKNSLPPYEILNGQIFAWQSPWHRWLWDHLHCVGFLPGEACMCQGIFSEGDRCSKYLWTHVFRAAFRFSFMQYGDVYAALGQDPVRLYERAGGLYQGGRKSVALLSDAGYCFGS